MPSTQRVTKLLEQWGRGDRDALGELMPLVEEELHRLARRYMRKESPGHTLQTTALVNEAYLKLAGQTRVRWQNRAHFFAIASQTMRRILIDHARSRRYEKRGGGAPRLSLEEAAEFPSAGEKSAELLALDEALDELARFDERAARVVEMRFFGGLTVTEAAEVLGVNEKTVDRDWQNARAWLYGRVRGGD